MNAFTHLTSAWTICRSSVGSKLVRVLRRYVEHYNQRRPHRGLAHATPVPSAGAEARSTPNFGRLRRCDVLGGLIHEYEYAA